MLPATVAAKPVAVRCGLCYFCGFQVYTFAMGALPKPEPLSSDLAELIEIEGEQVLRLPRKVHLEVKQYRVEQSGDSLQLDPVRPVRTREQIEAWLRSMHELEAGDVIPGGRNQGLTEPKRIFEDLDD